MLTYPEISEMRSRIKRELPAYAFTRTPLSALVIIAANAVVAALYYCEIRFNVPWYLALVAGLFIGYLFFISAIVAHDTMHGAILKNKSARYALTYFGFYPFFISPFLWEVWHTAHHSRTNTDHDPDANLSWTESQTNPFTRLLCRLMPSSTNRILGSIFYLYWFTAVGQALLWNNRGFKDLRFESYGLKTRRAKIDTFAYACFWLLLLIMGGPYKFVFVALVPMMTANAVFLAFATSEHIYRPKTDVNDALENTVDLKLPKIVDVLTLNFSHHVEHHLFPSMSYVHTPLLREWLRVHMRDRYVEVSPVQAARLIFGTQRLYKDTYYLVNLNQEPRYTVDTRDVQSRIRKSLVNGTTLESVL